MLETASSQVPLQQARYTDLRQTNLLAAAWIYASELSPLGLELNRSKMPGALPPASRAHLLREGTLECPSGTDNCEFVLGTHAVDIDTTYQ
jgi:hypothetical protein